MRQNRWLLSLCNVPRRAARSPDALQVLTRMQRSFADAGNAALRVRRLRVKRGKGGGGRRNGPAG